MRRTGLVLLLLLAGCGSVDERAASPTIDMSKYGPRHAVARDRPVARAPKLRPLAPGVARDLQAGAVGVVGLDGTVGVRPAVLDTASDAQLQRLRWSQWSASEARGSGQLRVLDCQPTCASGHPRTIAATVRLSDVRSCAGRRYFGLAEVTVAAGEQPASYVRAPC